MSLFINLLQRIQITYDFSNLTVLLAIPLAILILRYRKQSSSRRGHSPPSPFRLPIIGNFHQIGSIPHRSLRDLSRKHGSLMLLQLGQIPTLVVSSAGMAREVMKTQDAIFATRPFMNVHKWLLYGGSNIAFSLNQVYHKNMKKISIVHFLNTKKVQSYFLLKEEEVAFMLKKISQSASGVLNLSDILNSYANDVICRVVSGKCFREEGKGNTIRELIGENSALLGAFHLGDYFPSLAWLGAFTGLHERAQKTFNRWDSILDEVIEEHVTRLKDNITTQHSDFVDLLLNLQKDITLGFSLTKESIKSLVMEMFFAATDTSYLTLEWAMAELVRNSEVMKKLQDEIRGITRGKSMVKGEDLSSMSYLKAVIKETLRLHPPVTMLLPREAMKDTQIKSYQVPRKTRVIINAWAIGRDPSVWEEPEEFKPERFLQNSLDFTGNNFEFIPFGAGRRGCPGLKFGIATVEVALANLLYKFDWKLPSGMTVKDLDMDEVYGITTRRKVELHLIATPFAHVCD